MPSSVNSAFIVDGQNVAKSSWRTVLATAKTELDHGGFFTRLGGISPDIQVGTRLNEMAISARDFGGVPNNSLTTEGANAAPAINAAIDALTALGGGTVFLGRGVWWIGSSIILKPNVTVRGAGMESTHVKLMSGAAAHLFQNAAGTDVKYGIEDLTIDGNRDGGNNRRRFYDGIRWHSTVDSEPHLLNVRIRNISRDCIHLSGNRMRCMGHNLRLHSANRYGMLVSTFDNIWSHIEIAGIGADGIWIDQGFNYFTGGNIFFTGNGSKQKDQTVSFTNFFGETWLGMTTTAIHAETTPVAADWDRGCYIRINGGWCITFNHFGGQDSYGPGVVIGAGGTGTGQHRFTDCYFSNVGDLAPSGARHNSAGWPTDIDGYSGVRAIVETFAAVDCRFELMTRQQGTTFGSESTMCNYPWRNRNANSRNCLMRVQIPEFQSNLSAATHVTNQTVLETAALDASNSLVVNAL